MGKRHLIKVSSFAYFFRLRQAKFDKIYHIYTRKEFNMVVESFVNFLNRVMCFTSFVQKSSGFPNPLTSEEELECIKKFKNFRRYYMNFLEQVKKIFGNRKKKVV